MWFLQTSVDSLALPTDGVGRATLTGVCTAWYHIVRNSKYDLEKSAVELAAVNVHWSIWGWVQSGSRIHVNDDPNVHPDLLQMVREEPHRACLFANFRPEGKRQLDTTIELGIVLPPEQFARYQSLVQFAMTMPLGIVTMTTRDPILANNAGALGEEVSVIGPGSNCLIDGLEMVVSRAKPTKFSKRDLQVDRRAAAASDVPSHILNDHGDEWHLFRADPASESEETKARIY